MRDEGIFSLSLFFSIFSIHVLDNTSCNDTWYIFMIDSDWKNIINEARSIVCFNESTRGYNWVYFSKGTSIRNWKVTPIIFKSFDIDASSAILRFSHQFYLTKSVILLELHVKSLFCFVDVGYLKWNIGPRVWVIFHELFAVSLTWEKFSRILSCKNKFDRSQFITNKSACRTAACGQSHQTRNTVGRSEDEGWGKSNT